jgi:hypothetical protein
MFPIYLKAQNQIPEQNEILLEVYQICLEKNRRDTPTEEETKTEEETFKL